MKLRDLQYDVARWHHDRYPEADAAAVALKLAEESGEVCRAVLEDRFPSLHRPSDTSLPDELADVVIATAALAERAGIDLSSAVEARWQVVARRSTRACVEEAPCPHRHKTYAAAKRCVERAVTA